MHLSQYVTVFPCDKDTDYVFLYATRKAALIRVHKDTLDAIEKGDFSLDDESLLTELTLVTEDRERERQGMLHFREDLSAKNDFIDITVVLNLDCNFACRYCFEEAVKSPQYMSAKTADLLIPFMESRLTGPKKNIKMSFYGGEPLLSLDLIRHIGASAKELADRHGGALTCSMFSNGSLFTRKKAELLAKLGLKKVQITIDGPPEVHNRYRPFTSGKGSFDTLIQNIKETWDLVEIHLGGNYDQSSVGSFVKLLDILEKEGLTPEKIASIKFDPIMSQPDGVKEKYRYSLGCKTGNEQWVLDAEIPLRKEILKRGYDTSKPGPIFCMVEEKDAFVVNHDGTLYKCPGFLGRKGFAVGDLSSGLNGDISAYGGDIWKNPTCLSCKYLPQCFGGCRYLTYLSSGRVDGVNCQKEGLDATLEPMIRQDLKYRPNSIPRRGNGI